MTHEQNKYYRSSVVLQRIAKYRHKNIHDTHEWMKRNYFGGSTTLLWNLQFEEIMKKIRVDFSKKCYIPAPNEEDLFVNKK